MEILAGLMHTKDPYLRFMASLCATAFLFCALAPIAQAEPPRHYKIEAAFLYNFLNYITWPGYSSPEALVQPTICLEENDAMVSYLTYVQRKMAAKRPFQIRQVRNSEFSGCHMVFLRYGISAARLRGYLSKHTLVVNETSDPLERGGLIELAMEDERLTMNIDKSTLTKHGFQVSSRLLDLAEQVR